MTEAGRAPVRLRSALGAAAIVGVGVVAGAGAGQLAGERRAKESASLRARRAMIDKITQMGDRNASAADALEPTVAALAAREAQLERDNTAALTRLRARATVTCETGNASVVRLAAARAADLGVAFAESLRDSLPCGAADLQYDTAPAVSVDVVDFGSVDVGPCAATRLLRMSFRCSYVEFEQDCAGDAYECEDVQKPEPSYEWDNEWGCIVRGYTGATALSDESNCPIEDVSSSAVSEAHLYWLWREGQAVYLSLPSVGWPELSDAEVTPGQEFAMEHRMALRADSSVKLPLVSFPDSLEHRGVTLDARGDVDFTVNAAAADAPIVDGAPLVHYVDSWQRVGIDGRARNYVPALARIQTFETMQPPLPASRNDEFVCTPTLFDVDDSFVQVGSDGPFALYVKAGVLPRPASDGTPVLAQVYWATALGELRVCNNRSAAPHAKILDEPPWEAPEKPAHCRGEP